MSNEVNTLKNWLQIRGFQKKKKNNKVLYTFKPVFSNIYLICCIQLWNNINKQSIKLYIMTIIEKFYNYFIILKSNFIQKNNHFIPIK